MFFHVTICQSIIIVTVFNSQYFLIVETPTPVTLAATKFTFLSAKKPPFSIEIFTKRLTFLTIYALCFRNCAFRISLMYFFRTLPITYFFYFQYEFCGKKDQARGKDQVVAPVLRRIHSTVEEIEHFTICRTDSQWNTECPV